MDNVTHALAGCLLAANSVERLERRIGVQSPLFRRAAVAIGVITAELPDADLVYAGSALDMGKLGYLLHHRGHTHTVVFALLAALVVWGIALALSRDLRAPPVRRAMLNLALVASFSHVALDFTNSYGVHPFWPVDNRWYYGDAVFIVEPWLWIAALPPLMLLARGFAVPIFFGLLLVIILGAAWRMDMVPNGVALTLTIGAVLWIAAVRAAPEARRVILGFAAWIVVEAIFFATAAIARQRVVRAVGSPLRDAVISPAPGNPLCFDALLVEENGGTYRVSVASVAPFPNIRSSEACAATSRRGEVRSPEAKQGSGIRIRPVWHAPVAELRELAAANCEVSAALRFIRVPVWRFLSDGDVEFSDLRYGEGSGSFASIVARRRPDNCPRHVPPWEAPRNDVLRAR